MKKVISLGILMGVLFLGTEILITFLTKHYEITYSVYSDKQEFKVIEKYEKTNNDTYDIEIKYNDISFYYEIPNTYNKQKKLIKNIEYFQNNDDICIYPILKDNKELFIECVNNNNLYTEYSYPDSNFIINANNTLVEKGYKPITVNDVDTVKGNTAGTFYENNIPKTDSIVFWQYKGIDIMNYKKESVSNTLSFDKYDNNLGILVDNYYIIPDYVSAKLFEFSSVTLVNVNTNKKEKVTLGYTLSSDTYINGVINGKVYYTDPTNLIQIEFNPSNNKTRLLGNADLGGQVYKNGNWSDANIYDFRTSKILFRDYEDLENYQYVTLKDGLSSYYFYTTDGNVYQAPKNHLDKPILLFKTTNLNNFNVVGDDIYYVSNNTVYYFNINNGAIPILINNDLVYNTTNRISVYRDK